MNLFRTTVLAVGLALAACSPTTPAFSAVVNPLLPDAAVDLRCNAPAYIADFYHGDEATGYKFEGADANKIEHGLIELLGPRDVKTLATTIWFVLDLADNTAAAFLFNAAGCWEATADVFYNRKDAVDFFDYIGVMPPFGLGFSQLPGTPGAAPGQRL